MMAEVCSEPPKRVEDLDKIIDEQVLLKEMRWVMQRLSAWGCSSACVIFVFISILYSFVLCDVM